jgi:DNA repair protein RecO (recombination protein O)
MEWRDEGIVLSVRPHGEVNAVIELLTRAHGRHLGLVRGGRSRRMRPVLQAGNTIAAVWRARLEDHLGVYQVEPLELKAGLVMADPFKLAGLLTITTLAGLLPEREPHPRLHEATELFITALDEDDVWPALLVRWELGLLDELGFGLDLSRCAATGTTEDLAYVSPRSGRAVGRTAGAPYRDKLFHLPPFLLGSQAAATQAEIAEGLRMTGHFLARHIFEPRGLDAPEHRARIAARLAPAPPSP